MANSYLLFLHTSSRLCKAAIIFYFLTDDLSRKTFLGFCFAELSKQSFFCLPIRQALSILIILVLLLCVYSSRSFFLEKWIITTPCIISNKELPEH